MSKICNCPDNILTINKDDFEKMIKELFIKVKKDIKNKYSSLIYEKNYNIDSFDKTLRKIIIDYNYYNNKNYNSLLRKVENIFLKNIAKYDDIHRKILSKQNVRKISEQPYFYFNEEENLKIKNKRFKSNIKLSDKEKYLWALNQRNFEIEVEKRLQKKNNKNNQY
jgi:hypothetical protein